MKIDIKTVVLLLGVHLIMSVPGAFAHTDVTAEEARELINSTADLTVVDVREPSEYCDDRGHIPGALNYPLTSGVLHDSYEELPMDDPILVVCRSGFRSNQAATFLDSQGFSMVYDMMGGMNAWTWETELCVDPNNKYSGGTGEPNDPYQIATFEDLMLLGETPEDYDKHFILTADIDLDTNLPGRKIFDRAVIAPDINDSEDWFQGNSFTGVFDGNSHVIRNLRIQGEGYLGLFGYLDNGAKISDLGLEAVEINGTGEYVGSLVSYNGGSITTSYSTGRISGKWSVGGLVALNGSFLTTSYSTATVTGKDDVGGLVGYNSGIITISHSIGEVIGDSDVGGLVGNNLGRTANSYSICSVSGQYDVGGFIGSNGLYHPMDGGLVGPTPGNIVNCYSAGSVYGTDSVGGLVGENSLGEAMNSFWDIDTSGQMNSAMGTGKTTAEMQNLSTYMNAAWDLVDEVANGTCDYWQVSGSDYPQLRYHASASPVMPEGLGTAAKPYLIRDARDLGTVWFEPMANYRLEASIDLSGITWSMSVVPLFEGTFDGNGCVIENLKIQGSSYLGLFGELGYGAKISDLGLEAVDVNGVGSYIGSLVGNNSGRIATSYSSGMVRGHEHVGGLVGRNNHEHDVSYMGTYIADGVLSNCHTNNTVNGDFFVGGLAGTNGRMRNNEDVVSSCYSTGMVNGNGAVGGLIGYSRDNSSITSSFWDIETSGQTTSAGGIGKTTAEMQKAGAFLEAGWDFADETDNGTEDIWSICEGTNYPRFVWQIPAVDFVCPDGITIEDFSFFMEHWLDDNCDSSNGYCEGTDLDQSGSVDVIDLEIFIENWPDKN